MEMHNSDSKLGYIKLPKNANIQYMRDKIVVGKNGKKLMLTVPMKDGNTISLNVLETQTAGGFKAFVDGKKLFVADTQDDVTIPDYIFVSDGEYSNVLQFRSMDKTDNIITFKDIGSGSEVIVSYSNCGSGAGTTEIDCTGTMHIGESSYSITDIDETDKTIDIDAYSGADYSGNIPLMTRNGGNVTLVTGEAGITYSEAQITISEIDTTEPEPEGTGKIIVINATTITSADEIDKVIIRENSPSEMTLIDSIMNIYAGFTSYGTYIEDNRVNDVVALWYPDRQTSKDASIYPRLNVSGYILGSSYPHNLAIDIGNDDHIDEYLTGELNSSNSPKTVNLYTSAITDFLQKCSPDSEGYCNLPLKFSSDTDGIVRVNSIDIRYTLNTKVTGKEDALNNIIIWARDISGNIFSATQYFTIEKPPIITINYPEDNTIILSNTTHFNLTTDEDAICLYSYWTYHYLSYPSYSTYAYCYDDGSCKGVGSASSGGGVGGAPAIMDITGKTQHSQKFSVYSSGIKSALVANCTDTHGNSNESSVTFAYRDKPLTIDLIMPDNNTFYYNQDIKIYLGLTTNYSIDKIILNITRPDNTTEIFTENDFSENIGAKEFLKLINMSYNGLTQTGNYAMQLYVNDTMGNSDTTTRTFSVFNRKSHFVNVNNDRQSYIYYTNHDTGEIIAVLKFSPQGYSNITLPGAVLDMFFTGRYYPYSLSVYSPFTVIIPSLNLSDATQSISIEEKYVNESNMSIGSRYIPKESYAFNILNASRMNKTFRVEFNYYLIDHGLTDPAKIVILKAPYNFTTDSIDYSSAVYYSVGNSDYPLYYNTTTEDVWIYVNDFSVFALLEDKATSEVCADNIDNDYDGSVDEGCTTGGSGSSSGGGAKSAPPIKRECTNNSNCTSTQICSNYKCINITCSTCEYIEDRSCKKYSCCADSECNAGELCKDHSCIKIAEEKEPTIAATGEQILADNAIDSAKKAISSFTGKKDTKDAEEFLSKAIAARNNNDYANASALAEKSRLSLESAPLIQGKAIESAAERPDLLLIALVAILILLIIMVLFPKKKSAVSGSKKHQ